MKIHFRLLVTFVSVVMEVIVSRKETVFDGVFMSDRKYTDRSVARSVLLVICLVKRNILCVNGAELRSCEKV